MKGYRYDNLVKQIKAKKLLQNVSLMLISMIIFGLLVETALSFLGYGDLILYQPDPELFWRPKPNQLCYTKFGRKPVYINSKGTRGKDFSKNKPEGGFRVLCLGDSKTFGWGLSEAETYTGLLQELFQDYYGDSVNVEVINAGVNAWSYPQMYTYLQHTGIKYDPDLVILADANLWTQFFEGSSPEFVTKMMRQVWLKNLLRRSAIYHFLVEVKLQRLYYKYRKKFIPIDPENDLFLENQQSDNPYDFFHKAIANLGQLLNHHHIKGLIIYIPHKHEVRYGKKSKILPIKQTVSESFEMPLVDFTESFRRSQEKLYFDGDPVHPNVEGNRIIAEQIFEYLIDHRLLRNTE